LPGATGSGPTLRNGSTCGSPRRSPPCGRCPPSRSSTSRSSTPTRPATRLYYEELVSRLRPGGLLILDNVLQGGQVLDRAFQGEAVVAMRQMNEIIAGDGRVESVMLPVRDGVTLARKR
jgi:O-methyltransferase